MVAGGVAGVVKDEQRGRRALSAARARADRGAGAHIFSSARRLETRWAAPFPTRETAATRQRADRIGTPARAVGGDPCPAREHRPRWAARAQARSVAEASTAQSMTFAASANGCIAATLVRAPYASFGSGPAVRRPLGRRQQRDREQTVVRSAAIGGCRPQADINASSPVPFATISYPLHAPDTPCRTPHVLPVHTVRHIQT